MSNPPKERGTRAETAVVRHLVALGIPAERRALKGAADDGDVWAYGGRVVIEVKRRRTRPHDEELSRMWGEANREASRVPHADVAMLVVKRPGRANPALWWAFFTHADLCWLSGLDPDELPMGVGNALVQVTLRHACELMAAHPDLEMFR